MASRARDIASVGLQLANATVVVASFAAFGWLVGQLPDRVPVHWGISGPDRWGSPHTFWIFGGIQLFDTLAMWAALMALARRPVPPPEAPPALAELEARRRRLEARIVEGMLTGFNVAAGAGWLLVAASTRPGAGGLSPVAIGVLVGGVVASIAIAAAIWGRRALRVTAEMERLPGAPPPETRPEGWRLGGLIYYAPDDPNLFVPKRFGVGSTVNFARPAAWLVLALLLALPLSVLAAAILLT